MKSFYWLCLTFLVFTSCLHTPKSEENLPVSVLFKTEKNPLYTLSPLGDYYLFINSIDGNNVLQINYLDTATSRIISLPFSEEITQIALIGEFAVLTTCSNEQSQIWTANIKEENPIWEKGLKILSNSIELMGASQTSSKVTLKITPRGKSLPEIWELQLDNGIATLTHSNPGNVTDWIINSDGKVLGNLFLNHNKFSIHINDSTLPFGKLGDQLNFISTTDQNTIEYLGNIDKDHVAWFSYNLLDATSSQISGNINFDIHRILTLPYSNKNIGYSFVSWKEELIFTDNNFKVIASKISSLLEKKDWKLISADSNTVRIIVQTYSDIERGSYYLYDQTKNSITKLHSFSPWLSSKKLMKVNVLERVINEQPVYSYLYLPKKINEKTPTIVGLHDGPFSRVKWEFNPFAQYLCGLGYAYLEVNYQGSMGFGKKYQFSHDGKWQNEPIEDIEKWVKFAIQKENLNSEYIYLYGSGFGGYLALECKKQYPSIFSKTICDVKKWKDLSPNHNCGEEYIEFFENTILSPHIFTHDSSYMQILNSPHVRVIYHDKIQDSIDKNPYYRFKLIEDFYKK